MTKLETTLENFSKNTTAASKATDHSDELEQHVAELVQVQVPATSFRALPISPRRCSNAPVTSRRGHASQRGRGDDAAPQPRKAKRDAEVDHLTGSAQPPRLRNRPTASTSEARAALDSARRRLLRHRSLQARQRHLMATTPATGPAAHRRNALGDLRRQFKPCGPAWRRRRVRHALSRRVDLSEARSRLTMSAENLADRRLVARPDEPFADHFSAGVADVFDS